MPARIHDLLEIDVPRFLQEHPPAPTRMRSREQSAAPRWAAESLQRVPFVVVRRGSATEDEIPVGVRGARRSERWATSCHPRLVKRILTPEELLDLEIPDRMPALRALHLLKARWRQVWGPGGSVGFELATGAPVVTPDSDLDAVIYAAHPIDTSEARSLLESTRDLPAAVDVRVETPRVGFSLAEYVDRSGATLLLRTPAGAVLGTDPWCV
jgi:phosphoribosyl-dephospho-CoA transferase